mmetsp:Transcript_11967/g.19839  ORF Transcript_11967/g.19839 Transcript_11967/m.19839 type:complete len:173 (+) Transcript_11967:58-576(+)|eukprot:CAMPEP_0119004572 /NCGR_PEP_ID=MMETSP1176-20130426/1222_1 /TAXON_ID=265551 /ORGANISM="Synedropsis recta cf, Strain CCMP1620" /LENGTH=172 /DNA_ID=CAMNT_0006956293 /DNA_START=17 /DNA_END=535 /DNA_ORIENTATION=+
MTTATSFPSLTMLLFLLLSILSLVNVVHSRDATGECLPVGEEKDNVFHCISNQNLIPCTNEHAQCDEWAQRGECKQNTQYMVFNCRKACETCVSLHHGTTQRCDNIDKLEDTVKLLVETQQYVYDKTEIKASMYRSCINRDPQCATFALKGECQANVQWMLENCPAACKMCK